jgi:Calpain family cysteine protease
LRNPWGESEWTGEWADNSPLWTAELNKKYGHKNADDGTFFIPFKNFFELYSDTHFCANGNAEKMDIHEAFVDFNTYK